LFTLEIVELNCTQCVERSQQFETIFQYVFQKKKKEASSKKLYNFKNLDRKITNHTYDQNTNALIEFETKSHEPRNLS